MEDEISRLRKENKKNLRQINWQKTYMSDGERAIASFLKKEKIRYIHEFYLGKLTGDSKSYRVADFYLPEYGIYVEHLGRWNRGGAEEERYREKMNVYRLNGIICIYIFPNHLNNLTQIFKKRFLEAKEMVEKKENAKEKPLIQQKIGEKSLDNGHILGPARNEFLLAGFILVFLILGCFVISVLTHIPGQVETKIAQPRDEPKHEITAEQFIKKLNSSPYGTLHISLANTRFRSESSDEDWALIENCNTALMKQGSPLRYIRESPLVPKHEVCQALDASCFEETGITIYVYGGEEVKFYENGMILGIRSNQLITGNGFSINTTSCTFDY